MNECISRNGGIMMTNIVSYIISAYKCRACLVSMTENTPANNTLIFQSYVFHYVHEGTSRLLYFPLTIQSGCLRKESVPFPNIKSSQTSILPRCGRFWDC